MIGAFSYAARDSHENSMRAKHCVFGLGLFLASTATSLPALAQQPGASPAGEYPSCAGRQVTQEESDAAHKKYTAGKVDYDEANYDSAINLFRDSYKKDCTKHEILIIISRAYEQKGDRPEAIRALEAYLQRVPNAPEKSTYESRIQKLKELMEKDRQKAAAASAAAASQGGQGGGEKAGGHTIYPWILVGVGGAAVIGGAVLLVARPAFPPNCDKETNECRVEQGGQPVANPTDQQKAELAKDQERAGNYVGMTTGGLVLLVAGAGLVAGGLVWHFVEPTVSSSSASNKRPKLGPAVAPGYAGLSLGGSF